MHKVLSGHSCSRTSDDAIEHRWQPLRPRGKSCRYTARRVKMEVLETSSFQAFEPDNDPEFSGLRPPLRDRHHDLSSTVVDTQSVGFVLVADKRCELNREVGGAARI